MKSKALFALLYSAQVSAIKLRDIFDAYDEESLAELNNQEDQIDPQALSAEIGAEQITKDVKGATKNLAENTMIQLGSNMRPIIDADGDGVEDNEQKTQHELDRFRKMVFSAPVEDLHNTQNGELPGHVRYGDFPEPTNLQSQVDVNIDARSANEYDKEPTEEAKKTQSIAQIRPIIDADGDGVEDNVHKTQEELDRARKAVFGPAVTDMHNTRNGELMGHVRYGEHPVPEGHIQDSYHKPVFKEDVGIETENMNGLGSNVFADDRALNEGDTSYVMTAEQNKLTNYISTINSPEDLRDATLLQFKPRRAIYDADGDGIEDNRYDSAEELDKFYIPAVFGVAEDLFNTHHGELPGHVQRAFDLTQGEPADTYSIVGHPWATK